MAHLCLFTHCEDGAWNPVTLEGESFGLAPRPDTGLNVTAGAESGFPAYLLHISRPGADVWLLTAHDECAARVNGDPVPLGARVLEHRDEVSLAGSHSCRFIVSTRRPAAVGAFPGADRPVSCPRCRQPIGEGDRAVRCPDRGAWHHQSDELPCWTYCEKCALCDSNTALDGELPWTPEGI